jgi:hypothetical protein
MQEMLVRLPSNSRIHGAGDLDLLQDSPLEAALAETKRKIASAFDGQPVIKVSMLVAIDKCSEIDT